MKNCSTCVANLNILDLQPPASEGEIKNAYRDMAKVWHPDRFQGDSRLSAKAEEKFKCIQNAHQELMKHVAIHSRSATKAYQEARPPREASPPTGASTDDQAERILGVFMRWAGDMAKLPMSTHRYLAEPQITEQWTRYVGKFYHDSSNRILGIIDLSRDISRPITTSLVFTPLRMVYRDEESFSVVKEIEYSKLKFELRFEESRPERDCVSTFFDNLAVALGDRPDLYLDLSVHLGDIKLNDLVDDHQTSRRLFQVLREVKNMLTP